jgi:hypothetical protein
VIHRHRVTGLPGRHLVRGPVGTGVGPGVPARPVGDRLHQRRAVTCPGPADGPGGRQVHGVGVVAVDEHRLEPIGRRPVGGRVGHRRHQVDGRVLHVEVVLADEHHREVPDHGHVEGLVKRPDVGGPVTEEADGHLVGPPHPRRPGGPVGDAEVGADDGVGAHHPPRDVGEVHRPALPAEHAVLPPEQLGEGRSHLHSPGQRVGVTPVGGEGVIPWLHGGTETGGDGLHAEGQVGRPLDQVLEEQVVGSLGELPQLLEGAVHPDPGVQADVGTQDRLVDRSRQSRVPP